MNYLNKKTAGVILVFTMLFSACTGSKEIRKANADIKGEWTVQTVSLEGTTTAFNVKALDEAGFKCFIGSVWNFKKNNNGMGFYGLQNNGDCPAVKRNIHWAIFDAGKTKGIRFGKLDDNMNLIDRNIVYSLDIAFISETNMQLKWNISYENKPAAIVFNFTKNK